MLVFLDANIYLHAISNQNSANEYQNLLFIRLLLDRGQILLLVPKIVQFEIKNNSTSIEDRIKKEFEVPDHIQLLKDEKKHLLTIYSQAQRRQEYDFMMWLALVDSILAHNGTIIIDMNNDIFLSWYMRWLQLLKPYNKSKNKQLEWSYIIQNDTIIVESLRYYLSEMREGNRIEEGETLLFCTNDADYASGDDLSEDVVNDFLLYNVSYYNNLAQLLRNEFNMFEDCNILLTQFKEEVNAIFNVEFDWSIQNKSMFPIEWLNEKYGVGELEVIKNLLITRLKDHIQSYDWINFSFSCILQLKEIITNYDIQFIELIGDAISDSSPEEVKTIFSEYYQNYILPLKSI